MDTQTGSVRAAGDPTTTRDETAHTRRPGSERAVGTTDDGPGDHREAVVEQAIDRQHERYGGLKLGSAFFGWLVAVGLGVLLTALLSAAGAAVGLTRAGDVEAAEAVRSADTIGIVGGILLLVIFAIAYYCGGYVAGRMARFDGARQGAAVWAIALLVMVVLAIAGAVLGSEFNVLAQLNLPRIPIDEGTLTTGGIIALVAILLVSLVAAIAGGKAGAHFHRKVDRAAI